MYVRIKNRIQADHFFLSSFFCVSRLLFNRRAEDIHRCKQLYWPKKKKRTVFMYSILSSRCIVCANESIIGIYVRLIRSYTYPFRLVHYTINMIEVTWQCVIIPRVLASLYQSSIEEEIGWKKKKKHSRLNIEGTICMSLSIIECIPTHHTHWETHTLHRAR